jgi:hypothetical protein
MNTIESELIRDCIGGVCLVLFAIIFYLILYTEYFNKE